MEKEKTLLNVIHTQDGTGVHVSCDSMEELFFLCVSLYQTIEEYPLMKHVMAFVKESIENDPEFKDLIQKTSVSSKDLDDILKNIK